MSLNSAFQIGRTGLTVSQLGLQVTGNNISNAASAGYSRQSLVVEPVRDNRSGRFYTGRGAEATGIRRGADEALSTRLRSGIAQDSAAQTDVDVLAEIESTLNGLGNNNLSSELNRFFDSWSELSNSPGQPAARSLVVQQGRSTATYLRSMRTSLTEQQGQIDRDIASNVEGANALLGRISALNVEIAGTGGGASALQDQRDEALSQLSTFINISTVANDNGTIDVFVGSTPLVQGGRSRGVGVVRETVGGESTVRVTVGSDQQTLDITGGRIGSLLSNRNGAVADTIDRIDTLASQLVYLVNRAHSTGLGSTPFTSLTGNLSVPPADQARAFNDPSNATFAPLSARGVNVRSGSFLVTMKNTATGASESVRVNVDLDGITNAGTAGTTDDTSLTTLQGDLDAIGNLAATVDSNGRLRLDTAPGYEVSFSDDSSGALAVLGVNTYFQGTGALDIAVRDDLIADPSKLAIGRMVNGERVDNGAALEIAQLRNLRVTGLGGVSLLDHFVASVQSVGTQTGNARTTAQASAVVKDNLDSQRQAIAGVSIDEEAVNLLLYQRQFQASAQFITKVDELTQTLLGILR